MAKDKPPFLGLIQRGGEVVLRMLANVQQTTIKPIVEAVVAQGTLVHTDEYGIGSVRNLGRYAANWIAGWPNRPSSTAALT